MVLYCYSFCRSLWLSLRLCKGCHLTSSCRFSRNISCVQPVAICAPSFCILSSSCFSYRVHLSQMTSEYSRRGLMKVVNIILRDFLSSLNLSLRIILIRPHALSVMYFMCLCHVQSADKITPRCL